MILTIVLAIVFWVVLSDYNHRIKALEQMLGGKKNIERVAPAPVSRVEPLHVAEHHVTKEMWPKAEHAISREEDSGKLLGRMGIGAVFLAVAFFIKYAFDNNWVTETGRIVVGVIIGFILIGIGQYLRKKYLHFSEILTGGGIAVLYLSVYAAHAFYDLTSVLTTAILLVAVTIIAFIIALANEDLTLSILAIIGGFITPFLVGSDTNNMYEIFGYISLLNLFVLGLSRAKKWQQLGLIALGGTVINFLVWSMNHYTSELLVPTMFFLGITFLIFLFASAKRIIATESKVEDEEYVLISGNVLFFALSSYFFLYADHKSFAAVLSLLLGITFGVLTSTIHKTRPTDHMLSGYMAFLSIAFITLAIPLQFSGITIAILWLVEALAISFLASSFKNAGLQSLSVGVYCLGLLNFFAWNSGIGKVVDFTPILNNAFGVLAIAIVVAYIISHFYKTNGETVEAKREGMVAFIIIANILTLYAFTTQIVFYHQDKMQTVSSQLNTQYQKYNNQADYQNYILHSQNVDSEVTAIKNRSHTYVSILWAIYAAVLTAIGFANRVSYLRRIGLFLFVITAIKVFIDVWSLGQLYRIISFIVFGVIALVASFAYAKYKDRLKDVI